MGTFIFKLQHITTEKSNCLKCRRHKAFQNHKVKSTFKQNPSAKTLVWLRLLFGIHWEPNPGLTKNELVTLQIVSRRLFPHCCLAEASSVWAGQPLWISLVPDLQRCMLSWKRGEKKRGDSSWALLDLNSGFKFSEVRVQLIKSAAV